MIFLCSQLLILVSIYYIFPHRHSSLWKLVNAGRKQKKNYIICRIHLPFSGQNNDNVSSNSFRFDFQLFCHILYMFVSHASFMTATTNPYSLDFWMVGALRSDEISTSKASRCL